MSIVKNTWAEGLHPTYRPMDQKGSELFLACTMSEMTDPGKKINFDNAGDEMFLAKIVKARIEGMNLPIKFTDTALACIASLTRNPGGAVMILVDCLNAFEGGTVKVSDLADLYPMGFYDENTVGRYIDNYLKPRKVKWSEIY